MAIETKSWEAFIPFTGFYESIVLDEAHSMGAYPKPSKRAKQVKQIVRKQNPYVTQMSGTPTPESYSQIYHQVYFCPMNPFRSYINFYNFSKNPSFSSRRSLQALSTVDGSTFLLYTLSANAGTSV